MKYSWNIHEIFMKYSWIFKKIIRRNLEENFEKKNLIHIITRKIPRGVLATRVCLARNPRNKSRKNFEKKFWQKNLEKKNWKKKLEKKFEKNSEKKFWQKNLEKKLGKKNWKKNLGKSFDKKFFPNFFFKIFSLIFFQDPWKNSWIIHDFMNYHDYSWNIHELFMNNSWNIHEIFMNI